MKSKGLLCGVLSLLLASAAAAGVNDPKIPAAASEKAAQSLTGAPGPIFLDEESLYEREVPGSQAGPLPYAPQAVFPEAATRVALSSVDVNRIVCEEGPVRDVIYSREKGLNVTVEGSSAFVKFSIAADPQTGEKLFARYPVELYVVCARGSVYTLIAAPERIPAQTVLLKSPTAGIEKVRELFNGMAHEEKVINLIRWAYREQIPEVLTVRELNQRQELFEGMMVVLRRTVDAEGEGLRLKEYLVSSEDGSPRRVEEKDFLRPEVSRAPLAIALSDHEVGREPVRLFVVERRVGP